MTLQLHKNSGLFRISPHSSFRKKSSISVFLKTLTVFVLLSIRAGLILANTVEGRVFDAQTGESLPGVNVHIKGTSIGTITNYDGFYLLQNVREGVHVLVASYIGYENAETEITVVQDGELVQDFHLSYGAYSLSEVSITVQAKGQFSAINQQIRSLSISNIVAAETHSGIARCNCCRSSGQAPGCICYL
jgi:hypothetical protein